jgi:hypothetical protein
LRDISSSKILSLSSLIGSGRMSFKLPDIILFRTSSLLRSVDVTWHLEPALRRTPPREGYSRLRR